MGSFIWAMTWAMLPATIAAAQLLENPAKPNGDRPAEVKRDGNVGREANGPAAPPQSNAMFAAIDADGDGVITKLELRKAIKALMTLDTDDDGNITLAEASVGAGPAGLGGAIGDDPQIVQLMAYDKNGDGKLTANEVPDELMPMFQGADQNNDRAIDRQELVAVMANMRNQFRGGPGGPWAGRGGDAEQVTGQFLQYDRNGDGRLTENELPPQATRMLQGADQNNDGAIDAGELQAALARMGDRARAAGAGVGPDNQRAPFRDPNRRRPGGGDQK